MEDEDSKIRRNLVAASMLILLAVWLRAPLEGLSEQIFKFKPAGPGFAWRVWVAAGAALVYFALRYRFSQDNSDAINQLLSEVREVEKRVMRRWVASQLAQWVRKGSCSSLEPSGLSEIAKARIKALDKEQGGDSGAVLSRMPVQDVARMHAPKAVPVGKIPLGFIKVTAYMVFETKQGRQFPDIPDLGFELSRFAKLRIRCSTIGWVLIYSRGSTAVLLPWVLAILAMAAVIYKIIRTW